MRVCVRRRVRPCMCTRSGDSPAISMKSAQARPHQVSTKEDRQPESPPAQCCATACVCERTITVDANLSYTRPALVRTSKQRTSGTLSRLFGDASKQLWMYDGSASMSF